MKSITEAIKNIEPNQIDELCTILLQGEKTNKNSSKDLLSRLLTFFGINLILSHLSQDEQKVLSIVYKNGNGITFSEIEKILKIDTTKIDEISNTLSKRLLVYVLKNIQKLHNKLNKIYIFPEICDLLNILEENTISNHYNNILNNLKEEDSSNIISNYSILKDKESHKLIEMLFEKGGIILFDEIINTIPSNTIENILSNLKEKNFIEIYNDLRYSSKTIILLNTELFIYLLKQKQLEKIDKKQNIHNHFYLLLNLIYTFDTVSTNGLFLTKQNEFRKIDIKRLSESMAKLNNIHGNEVSQKDMSQLSLYILYLLKGLKVKKDSIIISLKNIEEELKDPVNLLIKVIKLLHSRVDDPLFASPIKMPSYKIIRNILKLIYQHSNSPYSFLQSIYLVKPISLLTNDELSTLTDIREKIIEQFNKGMNFLCIMGIIEIKNGIIKLSDIGDDIVSRLFKTDGESVKEIDKIKKEIYINPDFSLIIPKNEIPSTALFHILTHTKVLTDDVILHSIISKNSIIKAHKRGMTQDYFISTLKKYSKNEIPQNLSFLLTEWPKQSINIIIKNVMIINSSHPSFLDELAYGNLKSSIVERISPTYAIIDSYYLDQIIKAAKKSNAAVRLFEDEDNENYD
ncbi:MAG: hypothetical protein SVR08_12185 [Spirochaetota bacterium]|nr:hypothetical protein [Spirochaetota bacterium]